MTGLIAFIIVFGILVVVHEFGHFYIAKKSGVRIREFAVGMGPKIFQTHRENITYTLRILPVGGYVRMAGRADFNPDQIQPGMSATVVLDDGVVKRINLSDHVELVGGQVLTIDQADLVDDLTLRGYWANDSETYVTLPVDHDAVIIESDGMEVLIAPRDTHFESAKLWQRALISAAGPIMNFILAFALFIGLAFAVPSVATNTIANVQHNSPAAQAGLRANDRIVAIDGRSTRSWNRLQETIQAAPNKQLKITFERSNGNKQEATIRPKGISVQGQKIGQIGVEPKMSKDFGDRISYGLTSTGRAFTTIWDALGNLVSGFSLNKLGGPVAIYRNTSTVAAMGVLSVISFMAWLSVNLGLMNLLPIPALDGGKLLLNLVEAIIRRPISPRIEAGVTYVGAALLIVLMLAVTGNDIFRYYIR